MTKARGAYRATYESIDDDRDWRRLTPLAKATFDTLKRRLGQYGIDILAVEALPRIVNCTAAELEAALAELETPKRGGRYGWIRRDEDVVWIVNGLRFEPTLFVQGENANANHRLGARRHAEQLHQLTHLGVVAEFAAYYGLGALDGPRVPMPSPMPSPMPLGMGGGMVGGIIESESESEREIESDTESESDARARSIPPATDSRVPPASPSSQIGYTDLPPDVVEFGATFYGRAPAERRRKIANQLLRLARGQPVRFKRGDVLAGSLARLAQKCREVLDGEDVRKPDAAIAVLLAKLGDSSDITADRQRRTERERADENRRVADEMGHAEAWLDQSPEAATSIDEELERQGYPASAKRDAILSMSRTWARRGLVLSAWRAAGAPELIAQETA